jgi:hypothetical protein
LSSKEIEVKITILDSVRPQMVDFGSKRREASAYRGARLEQF